MGKLAHQLQREAGKLVLLDQLVQVHRQQLERDAYVIAEGERLVAVYDIECVLLVLLAQMLQYADLLLGLPMEALLIAHYLQRDVCAQFVVVAFEHLAEAAFACILNVY